MNSIIKKYPELDSIVEIVADNTCNLINRLTQDVKSEMPYRAQYVLEEVIEILKSRV
jgi:hypothetical protein